jgi:phosphate transport system substrate-binding protein
MTGFFEFLNVTYCNKLYNFLLSSAYNKGSSAILTLNYNYAGILMHVDQCGEKPMFKLWNLPKLTGMPVRWLSLSLVSLLGALLLVACSDTPVPVTPGPLPTLNPTSTPVPATPLPNHSASELGATTVTASLIGGGSTRLEPVFNKWLPEYQKLAPNVKIKFESTNSGNGQAAFQGTPVAQGSYTFKPTSPVDFGASDFSFTGSQLNLISNPTLSPTSTQSTTSTQNREVVHLPVLLGAVVVTYRLDGYTGELRLSGPTLADIFLGKIKTWNDPRILADNENKNLPNKPLKVVIRPRDMTGSGTSELFSRYMALISTEMRDQVGVGSQLKWPTFGQLEGTNGAAVADLISKNDGAIGYVDQEQADALKLPYASLRNQSGRYIRPTVESVTASAQGVYIPDDFRTFVVNPEGENAYPIAGFSWIMVWKDLKNMPNPSREKALALVNMLWWGLNDGQKLLPSNYAPLPTSLIPRLQARFVNTDPSKVFLYEGKPLLTTAASK